ncbi:MAG: hypothetical protein IAF08_03675 [Rhizobacter sp.]|nr:hypothetical protein [Chlorobiales bacterium]
MLSLNAACNVASPLDQGAVQGYTATDALGGVISEDKDDWRIAEAYRNFFTVRPAYPNPAPDARVKVRIDFTQPDAVGRLDFYGINTSGNPILLATGPTPPLGTQYYDLNLLYLSPALSLEDLRGKLLRILIYDQRGVLVTYGDIQIPAA